MNIAHTVRNVLDASTFVSACMKEGISAKLGDAAFRTLDLQNIGEINRHQFLIGYWVCTQTKAAKKNQRWLEWRRKILYYYYNKEPQIERMTMEDFFEFLDDVGSSNSPELFGINSCWDDIIDERVRIIGAQRRTREDQEREAVLKERIQAELEYKASQQEHTTTSLTAELIAQKLQYAEVNNDYEGLKLKYRELEKQVCQLKLDNVHLQTTIEDLQDKVKEMEKSQSWNGVIKDTFEALESVGVPASVIDITGSSSHHYTEEELQDFYILDQSVAGSTR